MDPQYHPPDLLGMEIIITVLMTRTPIYGQQWQLVLLIYDWQCADPDMTGLLLGKFLQNPLMAVNIYCRQCYYLTCLMITRVINLISTNVLTDNWQNQYANWDDEGTLSSPAHSLMQEFLKILPSIIHAHTITVFLTMTFRREGHYE